MIRRSRSCAIAFSTGDTFGSSFSARAAAYCTRVAVHSFAGPAPYLLRVPSLRTPTPRGSCMPALPAASTPKVLEPMRRQFGVAHRVLDVLVPEVSLQRACVVAGVG